MANIPDRNGSDRDASKRRPERNGTVCRNSSQLRRPNSSYLHIYLFHKDPRPGPGIFVEELYMQIVGIWARNGPDLGGDRTGTVFLERLFFGPARPGFIWTGFYLGPDRHGPERGIPDRSAKEPWAQPVPCNSLGPCPASPVPSPSRPGPRQGPGTGAAAVVPRIRGRRGPEPGRFGEWAHGRESKWAECPKAQVESGWGGATRPGLCGSGGGAGLGLCQL